MQGDVVDEVICGDVTVVQGAFAMGIIGSGSGVYFVTKEAWLETNGNLSIIKKTSSKPVRNRT